MPSCGSGPSPIPSGSRAGSRCSATPIPSRSPALTLERAARAARAQPRASAPTPAILETAADGLADVAYLDGARERAEVPADLPEPPRRAPRPAACSTRPGPPSPTRRFTLVEPTPPALARAVRATRAGAARWQSTSRPIAGRSAPLPTGRPPTEPCACCRWRRVSAARPCAAWSTATPSRRDRSSACSPTAARSSRTTPATSKPWLTFHYGLPAWRSVFDTSCAFRVFERHWSIQDPGLRAPRCHARHRHPPPAGRAQGRPRPRLVGRRAAAARAARLRRLRRRRADWSCATALAPWPSAFGCTAQVLAASRTACVEAFRRLPQPHPDAGRRRSR